MKGFIRALRRQVLPWFEAPDAHHVPGDATVVVCLDDRRIGVLRKDGDEFVFSYDPSYMITPNAAPIAAFPELHKEYRSERLWPFFAVRLPPVEREDVRDAMRRRDIEDDDVFRLLGELSKRAVASPYRFALGGR